MVENQNYLFNTGEQEAWKAKRSKVGRLDCWLSEGKHGYLYCGNSGKALFGEINCQKEELNSPRYIIDLYGDF